MLIFQTCQLDLLAPSSALFQPVAAQEMAVALPAAQDVADACSISKLQEIQQRVYNGFQVG